MEDDACQGLHNLSISEESKKNHCVKKRMNFKKKLLLTDFEKNIDKNVLRISYTLNTILFNFSTHKSFKIKKKSEKIKRFVTILGTLAQCIQEKYSRLILQSKELVSGGKVTEALELNQKAYRLCPSDKLLRKIQRMQVSVYL